jgi:hypothetical protein
MNNIFLLDPDTMECTWENNLDLDPELIIGSFDCKLGFRDMITIATTRVINDRLYNPNKSKWISNKFLKSHLQKSIRRMKKKLAVKTAAEMIRIDLNDFLRRLPIIIIEDVTILSVLPTTIWLMIAYSKGYKLRIDDVCWLLGVVKSLAKCPYRTKIDSHKVKKYKKEWMNTNNILFKSILLRVSYGGMNGDMNMLKNAAVLAYESGAINLEIKKIEIDRYELKLNEILPLGMDFHVDKSVLIKIHNFLKSKDLLVNKETIRNWMWQTRSGINKRHSRKKEKENPIKKYHKDIDNICFEIVKNNYFSN